MIAPVAAGCGWRRARAVSAVADSGVAGAAAAPALPPGCCACGSGRALSGVAACEAACVRTVSSRRDRSSVNAPAGRAAESVSVSCTGSRAALGFVPGAGAMRKV